MNQIYRAFCAVLLAVLVVVMLISFFDPVPTHSPLENRALAQRPALSLEGLLDGSFFREYQLFFADTFPGRERLLDDFASLDPIFELSETEPTAVPETEAPTQPPSPTESEAPGETGTE